MSALVAGLIGSIPSIINAIRELIARGRQSGELTAADADALTAKAQAAFAQWASPAPPPPPVV